MKVKIGLAQINPRLGDVPANLDLHLRQIEEAVRDRKGITSEPVAKSGVTHLRPAEIIELEKRLGDRLGAKVKINYRNRKGKVEIRFASLEDLERIYRLMAN